jgi:hypothetical protein
MSLSRENRYGERTPTPLGVTAIIGGVFGLIVAIILVIGFIAGFASVPVDMVGLHYSGGPIEGARFQEVIPPGSGARFLGLSDDLVLLPNTQRDYTASTAEGADGGPILAPAQGGVEMQFDVAAYFTLNTGDDVVRQFYERVCVKFHCTEDAGWDEMLRVAFRGPIEQAVQQSIRDYTVDELYAGVTSVAEDGEEATAVLQQVQDEIAADLRDNINAVLGGAYFCGPTFNRAEPDVCPDFQFQITSATPTSESVRNSFSENAASAQAVITAQNQADADVAEAEGQRRAQEALQGLYTDPDYVAYLQALAMQACAANSNCTLVITDGGTGVNVNTDGGAG